MQLPAALKAEVLTHTHALLLQKIVFFKEKDPNLNWLLLPLLKEMTLPPKEILYRFGEPADESKS